MILRIVWPSAAAGGAVSAACKVSGAVLVETAQIRASKRTREAKAGTAESSAHDRCAMSRNLLAGRERFSARGWLSGVEQKAGAIIAADPPNHKFALPLAISAPRPPVPMPHAMAC